MSHQLDEQTGKHHEPYLAPIPSWLDGSTHALVHDIIETLTEQRADVLAVILYGSIARHDERPLDDPNPSDVDLLVVFNTDDEQMALREGTELFRILGQAYDRHLDARRDVKVMFACRTLREWDPRFIVSVARGGLLLWARGPLPAPLLTSDQDVPGFPQSTSSSRSQGGMR